MFEYLYLNRLNRINGKNRHKMYELSEDITHDHPNVKKLFYKQEDKYSFFELLLNGHLYHVCGYLENDKKTIPVFAMFNKDTAFLLIIPITKRCRAQLQKAVFLKKGEYQLVFGGTLPSSSNELVFGDELQLDVYSEQLNSLFSNECYARIHIPEEMSPEHEKAFPYLTQSREMHDFIDFVYEELLKQNINASKEE